MSDDSVIFAGFISDEEMASHYAISNVYATCSLWEGFNLPIIEAQSLHIPVVAFDLGPHPEVINEKGILVEPKNTEKFAEALKSIIKNHEDR